MLAAMSRAIGGIEAAHTPCRQWRKPHPAIRKEAAVYSSRFPTTPYLENYLRDGRITGPGETARDMVNRIVAALAAADRRFDPEGADSFARKLGEALDDRRIVFSSPVMTNAGRHVSSPLAACAVPPADLRGDLAAVKAIVDDYHRAGMGTGFSLDGLDDPVAVLRYLNQVAVDGAASGTEDRPVGNMAILPLSHPVRRSSSAASPARTPAVKPGSSISPSRSPTRRCAQPRRAPGRNGTC
jgi:hypothetical protein